MNLTLFYFDTSKDALVYADPSSGAPAYISVRQLQAIGVEGNDGRSDDRSAASAQRSERSHCARGSSSVS
jgi:hypothetical protein